MLSSGRDNESPRPESSDPLVAAAPSSDSPPGDGTDRVPEEGAASLSDPHHRCNFSIREYVFRSRSKDININWPFSRQNLQLCLRHGVTEVLPPFQHLPAVKCQSFEILKVKNRSFVGKNHIADFPSVPSSSKSKVPSLDCAAEENVPSVATRVFQASTEQLPAKTAIPPSSFNSGHLAKPMGKKCRLFVKFGAKSGSGDDGASNCTSVSENVGSKVCPVCRTFSSSSNTTLNAHIDQCLSLESMPKGLMIRHRVKPKKSRLMVDIYETAKRCTIEELNRRNGLVCANSSSKAASTVDVAYDEKRGPCRQMVQSGNPSDAGAVYRDANGTKLRILSKFNDTQVELRSTYDVRLKKSSPGNKGVIMFKKKTKKLHGQKRYKYHKIASKSKKIHSMKSHDSQKKNLCRTQENDEGSQAHSLCSQGPVKPDVSGTLKPWSSSKRTGLKKKLAAKEGEYMLRCQSYPTQDFLDEKHHTSLVSKMPMRSRSLSLLGSSESSIYSQSFDSEKEKSLSECHSFEMEKPGVFKRSLAWSDVKTDQQRGSFSRKALRFSMLRERALSLCQSSENSSDVSVQQRGFFFKMPKWHSAGGVPHIIEDSSQDQSVEEETGFEVSPDQNCERERTSLLKVAESSDISEKVHTANLALDDMLDAETSGDAVEYCAWGLSDYYDLTHHNDRGGASWTKSCSQQFLGISNESLCGEEDDFSRAYNGCDDVNVEIAGGKNDEGYYGARQSSSFVEIDPIPIPGPPGSFLPSPGATGSDDFQGNSSLTNSQAQSSHDNQDLIDGDASDSPVSTTSTVSNSAEAKWGMFYSEDLVSIVCPSLPGNPWTGFSEAGDYSSSIQQSISAAPSRACPETIGSYTDSKKTSNFFVKKGPSFTRDGGDPCCCQKKDMAVSQSSVLDYREMWPVSLRRQMDWISPTTRRSEVGSEGSIADAAKSSTMSSWRGFGEPLNGSDRADCDFPGPSVNNPVLRLMGKDLIVVNKEGNAATLDRSQSSPLAPAVIQDSQSAAVCGIPLVGDRNQKEYHDRDTDYTHPPSFFLGSSNCYPGITLPATVQAPKQKITKVAPLMNPGKEVMIIDDAYGKNSMSTLSAFDNGNLLRDVVVLRAPANASREESALPAVYQPREPLTTCEPVAGLAGSHTKVRGFRISMSGQDVDGLLLPRTSSREVTPQFLGHPGSGYPSFS